MKKIKNISQLRKEKKRLKEERERLEHAITQDWKEIRKSMRPLTFTGEIISQIVHNKIDLTASKIVLAEKASLFAMNLLKKIVEKIIPNLTKNKNESTE